MNSEKGTLIAATDDDGTYMGAVVCGDESIVHREIFHVKNYLVGMVGGQRIRQIICHEADNFGPIGHELDVFSFADTLRDAVERHMGLPRMERIGYMPIDNPIVLATKLGIFTINPDFGYKQRTSVVVGNYSEFTRGYFLALKAEHIATDECMSRALLQAGQQDNLNGSDLSIVELAEELPE